MSSEGVPGTTIAVPSARSTVSRSVTCRWQAGPRRYSTSPAITQRGRSKANLDREASTGRHWSGRHAGRAGSPVEAWVGRIGAKVPMIRSAVEPYRPSSTRLVAWMAAMTECEPQYWPPRPIQFRPQSML